METLEYRSEEDRLDARFNTGAGHKTRESINLSPLVGTWLNTNNETRGIVKVITGSDNGSLTVHVFGSGAASLTDWGEIKAETIYATGAHTTEGFAFSASYDFGFMEVYMQANLSLGLLVIACLNTFKNGNGRSNYFSREFFRHS